MAITLPLPVRVAAGILATGIDAVRSLPADIPAIPVALVGNALKLSMKVQQEIATLATRGDELLGGVVGGPEENPTWATFDDDEPAPAATRPPKAAPEPEPQLTTPEATSVDPTPTTAMKAAMDVPDVVVELALVATDDEATESADVAAVEDQAEDLLDEAAEAAEELLAEAELEEAEEAVEELVEELAAAAALEDAEEAVEELVEELAEEAALEEIAEELAEEIAIEEVEQVLADEVALEAAAEVAAEELAVELELEAEVEGAAEQLLTDSIANEPPLDDEPAALPGYNAMTLAQVRGHLRELSADEVGALLRYEQSGDNRAPFLTLLSNRLVTLDAQTS